MKFATVDEYIGAQPAPVQRVLRRVRGCIRKAVPEADESISYSMPAYKLDGRPVLYFAGWKNHCSIYPVGAGVAATFENELARYEIDKATLRFPFAKPVPATLIGRIARFRAGEIAAG